MALGTVSLTPLGLPIAFLAGPIVVSDDFAGASGSDGFSGSAGASEGFADSSTSNGISWTSDIYRVLDTFSDLIVKNHTKTPVMAMEVDKTSVTPAK